MKILFFIILFVLTIISNANLYDDIIFPKTYIKKIFQKTNASYLVFVKKRLFKLFIIDKKLKICEIFSVAIGKEKNFKRKIYQDDNATPEGLYYITEILSENSPTNTISYKKLKKMNSIYLKAKDGHYKWNNPNLDLGTNSYGPRFFRINYPNQDDKKLYRELISKRIIKDSINIGYGIGIHGTNDPDSIGHLITSGCIRMKNEEIVKLDKYIKIGTPVLIEK
jgi:murein L,D-transpeptidase YafK